MLLPWTVYVAITLKSLKKGIRSNLSSLSRSLCQGLWLTLHHLSSPLLPSLCSLTELANELLWKALRAQKRPKSPPQSRLMANLPYISLLSVSRLFLLPPPPFIEWVVPSTVPRLANTSSVVHIKPAESPLTVSLSCCFLAVLLVLIFLSDPFFFLVSGSLSLILRSFNLESNTSVVESVRPNSLSPVCCLFSIFLIWRMIVEQNSSNLNKKWPCFCCLSFSLKK